MERNCSNPRIFRQKYRISHPRKYTTAVVVIDALASRSVSRLCSTIQITDTGISPGAGVGNNRKRITKKEFGIPVLAIGVPTVVEAGTIISECFNHIFDNGDFTQEERMDFLDDIQSDVINSNFAHQKVD